MISKQEILAFRRMILANVEATKKLIRVDELEPEELEGMIDLYDEYIVNHLYKKDDIFKYGNRLYKVIKGLTSSEEWLPSETPSEYFPLMPENVIGEWEQRYSHNPYVIGERVIWQDDVYELILAEGSPYTPTDFPQGWLKIEA